jgi:RimJ/RimL family protein N-acetyltransferase
MLEFDPRPITLEDAVVRLQPIDLLHAEDLFEASRSPEIWTYLLAGQPKSLDDVRYLIEQALGKARAGTRITFAVVDKSTNRAVGVTCYFEIDRPNRWFEIGGTWYAVSAQRTAINTHCKYLLLSHAFEEQGAVRVQLKTDANNERSRRAIERIGGQFEGVLRNYQTYWNGRVRDTAIYSIVEREWPEVRANLEARITRIPADSKGGAHS